MSLNYDLILEDPEFQATLLCRGWTPPETFRPRKDTAEFIHKQLTNVDNFNNMNSRKHGKSHYGFQELKDLMDFVYGGSPESEDESIKYLWDARA